MLKNIFDGIKNLNRQRFALVLFITSLFGIIYGYIIHFAVVDYPAADNIWSLPLTFTYMSSTFIAILAGLEVFKYKYHCQKQKSILWNIGITMLTVTFCLYWTLLAPTSKIWGSFTKASATFPVHLITPLVAIVFYINEILNKKLLSLKFRYSLYNLVFPLIFLTYQIILLNTINEPIYDILDYYKTSPLLYVIYLIVMIGSVVGFGALYSYINNRISSKNG